MEQVNFRVSPEEKELLKLLAESKSITIAELARSSVLKDIAPIRVDLAFDLLAAGKIGRKKAWLVSGLAYHEFMAEWTRRGAEDRLPDAVVEHELETLSRLDFRKHMKPPK